MQPSDKPVQTRFYSCSVPACRPRTFLHLLTGEVAQAVLAAAALLLPAIQAAAAPSGLSAVDWASVQQLAYLKASNTDQNDQFGYAVAVSGDTMVIGTPDEASN